MLVCKTIKSRVRPRVAGVRRASTRLGIVDYDPDTHVVRSNLSVQVPNTTVSEFVWRDFKKWENLPALTSGVSSKEFTYGQAEAASRCFGINLSNDLSLKTGDTLGLVLPNMPEFPISFLGAASAGLVISAANPVYTSAELSHQFSDARVRAVVTTPELAEKVKAALALTPEGGGHVIVTGEEVGSDISFEHLTKKSTRGVKVPSRPDPESLVALPYSSGTTGKPKGVMLSHKNLVTNLCQLDHPAMFTNAGKSGGTQAKSLAILPMFHIYGLNGVMNLALFRGHQLITLPRFDPRTFVKIMKQYKPNTVCMAPPLVAFLCKNPDLTSEDLKDLRVAMNGAAPVALSYVKELIKKVNNKDFIFKEGYGLTEVSCCAAMLPTTNSNQDKFGSCGTPVPLTEVKVVDESGNALPINETGELLYKGPNVMMGYLNNEKANKETFTEDGWLRTGDVAYIDSDGFIFLVDRMKELIKVKGFQVSPTELEETLRNIPEIVDVAVIGIPDGKAGEVPKAFVVKKKESDLTEKQVVKFLEDKVAPFKQLRGGVQFIKEIPRSTAGKILRKDLKNIS